MKCPLQTTHAVFKAASLDTNWGDRPNGDITCSYCGSWHPRQFMAFLSAVIYQDDYNIRIEIADGGNKVYIHRPGKMSAGEGAIKVYIEHVKQYIIDKRLDMEKADNKMNKAIEISKAKFARYMAEIGKK